MRGYHTLSQRAVGSCSGKIGRGTGGWLGRVSRVAETLSTPNFPEVILEVIRVQSGLGIVTRLKGKIQEPLG